MPISRLLYEALRKWLNGHESEDNTKAELRGILYNDAGWVPEDAKQGAELFMRVARLLDDGRAR